MQWSSLQWGSRHGYMHLCVWGQSVFQRVESTACETEQQSTLTEKLPFCYPSLHPPALHSPLASHFFLLPPPPLFCVLPLPFSFSTSTGLSKWSQRNALWSNNPGGWHRRDEREKGGERTRRLGEWRNWEMETVARRGEETGWKLRCMKIRWKSSKLNMRTHLEIDGCPAS